MMCCIFLKHFQLEKSMQIRIISSPQRDRDGRLDLMLISNHVKREWEDDCRGYKYRLSGRDEEVMMER